MSTATLAREVMSMDEQQQARGPDRYPKAFRDYVLVEHQRHANANRVPNERAFHGLQLHATNAREMSEWQVPNPSTHFTDAFTRFLDAGIRAARREQREPVDAFRWARVEAAILWLEQEDPHLGIVLRYYQAPRWARAESLLQLAGRLGLSEEGPRRWRDRALRRLWWRLGGAW